MRDQRLLVPPQPAGAIVELAAGSERHAPRAAAEVADVEAGRRDRDVVVALPGEHAQLRGEVVLERPVAIEVIGLRVEQHGALGREVDRVLELKRAGLAHDDGLRREAPGDSEARQRRPDVPGDLVGQPGLAVDVAEQLDRRRLAVGPRDGDELVPAQQPPAELELTEDRQAPPTRSRDDRRLPRHARRLDDRAGAVQQRDAVGPDVRLDVRRHLRQAGVARDDPLAPRRQRPHRGHARPGQPDDEPRAGRQRGPLTQRSTDTA